jgi:hypothetical protein
MAIGFMVTSLILTYGSTRARRRPDRSAAARTAPATPQAGAGPGARRTADAGGEPAAPAEPARTGPQRPGGEPAPARP